MIIAGFAAQLAVGVGEIPGDGAGVFLLQVVDHVLQFFRAGAVLGFLRGDEQAAKPQITGVADAFGVAGDVLQGLGQVEVVNSGPALRGLNEGAGVSPGDKQIGAAVAFAFFGLFARGRLLQCDHLSHPSRGRKQAEVGFQSISYDDEVGKLSIVGSGMKTHSGVSATLFGALAKAGVNIEMISTSEIRISVVTRADQLKEATRIVHTAFELDAADTAVVYAGTGR